MKKRILNLTILTIILLIGLTGCGNLLSPKNEVPSNTTKVNITGKLDVYGVIPQDAIDNGKTSDRAAYPVLDIPSLTFTVTAEKADGTVIEGSVSSDKESFTIPNLDLLEDYLITVKATRNGNTILEGSTSIKLTTKNCSSITITMAAPSGATGSISLPVSFEDVTVTKIVYRLDNGAPVTIPVTSSTATISIPSVSSGNHILDLVFYNTVTDGTRTAEVYTYHCKEAVNVLPGVTTDTWIRNNAASEDGGHITDIHLFPKGMSFDEWHEWTSGPADFVLCSVAAELFANTQFYVISDYTGTEETGSIFTPFKTLEKAVEYVSSLPREASFFNYYHDFTIWLEADDVQTLTKDMNIADVYMSIDVYDNWEKPEAKTAQLHTGGHSITITGESGIDLSRIDFSEGVPSDTVSTEPFMIIDSSESEVFFKACSFDYTSRTLKNSGFIELGDWTDNNGVSNYCNFNQTEIIMEGRSYILVSDNRPEDAHITLNIKNHSKDKHEITLADNEKYFDFICGEYQCVQEGKAFFLPEDAFYVDPSSTSSSGTFQHPFSTLWDAIFYVITDQVLSEKTIYIKGGTTDTSFTGDNDFSTEKKITILAYDDNPLNAATDDGVAEIRVSSSDTTSINASSGCLIFKGLMFTGSNVCFTLGYGGDSQSSFTNCTFTPTSNPETPLFDITGPVAFDNCYINGFSGEDSGVSVRIEKTGVLTLSGSTTFGANDIIKIESGSNGNGRIHIETALTPETGANTVWKLQCDVASGSCILEGPGAASAINNFVVNGKHIDGGGCIWNGISIYVNSQSGSDSNNGSQEAPYKTLTKAISEASEGSEIYISTKQGVSDSSVTINKSLTLKPYGGTSDDSQALLNNCRVSIQNSGTVSFSKIMFQRTSNYAGNGGYVSISGDCNVNFTDCYFYRGANSSTTGNGGFLSIERGSGNPVVTCTRTDFQGASCKKNEYDGYGGAIYNDGILLVDSCKFSGNTAATGGGAIYSIAPGKLTVKDCTFENNKVNSTIPDAIGFSCDLILQGTNEFKDTERFELISWANITISNGAVFKNNSKVPLYWDPQLGDDGFAGKSPFADDYSKSHAASLFTIDDSSGAGFSINSNGKIMQTGISGSVSTSPLYETVTASSIFCGGRQYEVVFKDSTGQEIDVSDVTIEVWQYGDSIPASDNWSYGSQSRLNFFNALPKGTYTICVTFIYNDRSYSASFDITLNN